MIPAWLMTSFPTILMSPTFTLGPSATLKVTLREEGESRRAGPRWRTGVPRSATGILEDDGGALDFFGSYCDSTDRPTLRSLKRSRISETVTDLMPSYLMDRTTRRSTRTNRTMNPRPGSVSRRYVVETASVPQLHEVAAEGFRRRSPFLVTIRARKVSCGTRRAPRNSMASMLFSCVPVWVLRRAWGLRAPAGREPAGLGAWAAPS